LKNKLKLVIVLALIIVLPGVLGAQVNVRGIFEGAFVPFQYFGLPDDALFGGPELGQYPNEETGAILTGFGRGDAVGSYQAGIDIIGRTRDQNFGVRLQLRYRPLENNLLAPGDNLKLWWRPHNTLQIDVGKFVESEIRSKITPPVYFDFYLPIGTENTIFSRFSATGLLLQYTPITGLYFAAAIKTDTTNTGPNGLTNDQQYRVNRPLIGQEYSKYLYQRTQFAAAYTFGEVGQLRVQYFGQNANVRDNENGIANNIGRQSLNSAIFNIVAPTVEVAFNLTLVPRLTLDIGGKIPIFLNDVERRPATIGANPVEIKGEFQQPYVVSLGASYPFRRFMFNGLFSGKFGGWLQYEDRNKWLIGPELQAVTWVTYSLTDNLRFECNLGTILNADSIFDNKLEIKGGVLYGGGIFAQYNIQGNNNWVRTGVAFSTGTVPGRKITGPDPYKDPEPLKWYNIITIPIIFHAGLP